MVTTRRSPSYKSKMINIAINACRFCYYHKWVFKISLLILVSGCGSSSSSSGVQELAADCGPARVMPLGDSITQANTLFSSYRRPLWFKLNAKGYSVDFVGSTTINRGGSNPYQDFDLNHEGHWGWHANSIYNRLSGWLSPTIPNIVLIHLGTNDLHSGQNPSGIVSEIKQIVSLIRTFNPNVGIAIAAIIPSDRIDVTNYNNLLNSAVTELYSSSSPVVLADMQTGFNIASYSWDGVHPNSAGEEFMAERWLQSIIQLRNISANSFCG